MCFPIDVNKLTNGTLHCSINLSHKPNIHPTTKAKNWREFVLQQDKDTQEMIANSVCDDLTEMIAKIDQAKNLIAVSSKCTPFTMENWLETCLHITHFTGMGESPG